MLKYAYYIILTIRSKTGAILQTSQRRSSLIL